ncbi:MAG TPA: DNA cytosine methyltransferase [Trebonia sp.]|jgi:DNA (cytosine-5)-methyltransferase 1|nr:DNA cytosine methyltransferase [Trebonia sp.]
MTQNADYGGYLVDLYCGAGGATKGYQEAGYYVVGVDIEPQPSYCGDEFHQADAMSFDLGGFDVIHAGPPCQRYARVTRWRGRAEDHPDLLGPTIERLKAQSTPWIVENVPEAIPRPDLILCGSSFGLAVRRHRHFLTSWPSFGLMAPCSHGDLLPFMHKAERAYADALGCEWMNKYEARQAIPPAYTKWIGTALMNLSPNGSSGSGPKGG